MNDLIESIASNDLVSAKEIFEERMNIIREKKLYEKKRCIASEIYEASGGGMTKAEFDYRRNVLKYKKASDVLQDPRDVKLPLHGSAVKKPKGKKKKISEASFITAADQEAARRKRRGEKLDAILAAGAKLKKMGHPDPYGKIRKLGVKAATKPLVAIKKNVKSAGRTGTEITKDIGKGILNDIIGSVGE